MQVSVTHISRLQAPDPTAPSLAENGRFWVPSERVPVHLVEKPAAPRRKWHELLPWLLEERLLLPVDELHFAILGEEADKLVLAVPARVDMRDWLDQARQAGYTPAGLHPDFLALPWTEGQLTLGMRLGDEHLLVRSGRYQGFAALPALAVPMIKKLLGDDTGLALRVMMPEDELPQQLRALVSASEGRVDWNKGHGQVDPVVPDANLLTGEFAQKPQGAGFAPWLSTAALLLLTVVLSLTWLHVENHRLAEQVAQLQNRQASDFRTLFPGLAVQSGDMRLTLETRVADGFRQQESLQSSTMQLLFALDRAIADCRCRVQSLSVSGDTAELRLGQEGNPAAFSLADYEYSYSDNADAGEVTVSISGRRS